ncbi:MAG: VTT domain-containing protein [Ignavibacteria bacterium]
MERKQDLKYSNAKNQFSLLKDHLVKANQFYEKYGGKAIIFARFVPFARTFAPIVAGVANMNYRKFVTYNIAGGILG